MLDRRRLLQSAALGAGLAAVGGSALARIQTAAPVEGGPVDASFRAFMDRAFEAPLDFVERHDVAISAWTRARAPPPSPS